jgi:WD40 repeat protein
MPLIWESLSFGDSANCDSHSLGYTALPKSSHHSEMGHRPIQKDQPDCARPYLSNAIVVDPLDCSTNVKGIYAIGDINTYKGKLKLLTTDLKGPNGIAFSPDGRTLAVACANGNVGLWNLATQREVAVLKHGNAPLRHVVFSSDGQTLVSVCEKGTLRFWDAPRPDAAEKEFRRDDRQ